MIRKVVYFTRTGTCKRIAEKIAKSLSLQTIQLHDNKNWNGFIGYWKAGFFASTNREVTVELSEELNNADEYILITPIWAGSIAPATKSFLKSHLRSKINLVVSSNGSIVKDREGFISVFDIPKSMRNEDQVISKITKGLRKID